MAANSTFAGTLMAHDASGSGAGAVLSGRFLSLAGAVAINASTVNTPPTVVIAGGVAVSRNDATPTISGTSTGAAGRTLTVTIAGQTLTTTVLADGTWSVTAAPVLDGTYPVTATISDLVGNAASASQSLTVDSTPPVVTITGGATAFTNDTTPSISGTTDAAVGTTVTVTGAGSTLTTTVQSGGTWTVTQSTALAEGVYSVVVTVTDLARNTGSATQSLTVDTTAPLVSIDGGATELTNDATPTITGTTNAAAGSSVTLTVTGQILTTVVEIGGTWSVTASTLLEGTCDVEVSVTDPAGNTGTGVQVLTVNTPTNTTPGQTVVQGGAVVVTGDGFNELESVEVWLESIPVQLGTLTANALGNVSGSFTIPIDTALGAHRIVLISSAGVELRSTGVINVITPTWIAALLGATGADVTPGWFALLFLLLGGLVLAVDARRRHRAKLKSSQARAGSTTDQFS